MQRDARLSPRLNVHLAVNYQSDADLTSAFIDSLSQGGVFIRTSRPLPIGTELTMDITVKGEEQVSIRGRVVWERLIGREDGMGVAFLDPIPDRLRNLLTAKVA
jgi:type IV pilus assembly protein PilZ